CIAVEPPILDAVKVMSVRAGAAPDIQDTSNFAEIVMSEHRSEFLFSKGSLPQTIGLSVLHDASGKFHGRDTILPFACEAWATCFWGEILVIEAVTGWMSA